MEEAIDATATLDYASIQIFPNLKRLALMLRVVRIGPHMLFSFCNNLMGTYFIIIF